MAKSVTMIVTDRSGRAFYVDTELIAAAARALAAEGIHIGAMRADEGATVALEYLLKHTPSAVLPRVIH